MELDTDVPGVLLVLEFHDLHTLAFVIASNEVEASGGETVDILRVNFVSVTMALEDFGGFAVELAEF
jgi:hypothetical protein